MRTLRKEPGKPWEIVEVPNELEALQKAVGGHLERVTFASDICVLCDKEALCKGLPALFVKLTDADGKSIDAKVLSLMVDTWMGGKRPGQVPYHKNGDLKDNWVGNIGFTSRKELGRKTGAASGRVPVAKVTPEGEVVAVYSSARAAAKANHMSYQTVLDRCNGKVKKPFALDGHTYQFER